MIIFKVDELRIKKGVSKLELSKSAGISRPSLDKILKNETDYFNVSYLEKIADALGVDESDLFDIINTKGYKLSLLNKSYSKKRISPNTTQSLYQIKLNTDKKVSVGLAQIFRKKISDSKIVIGIDFPLDYRKILFESRSKYLTNELATNPATDQNYINDSITFLDRHLLKKIAKEFCIELHEKLNDHMATTYNFDNQYSFRFDEKSKLIDTIYQNNNEYEHQQSENEKFKQMILKANS